MPQANARRLGQTVTGPDNPRQPGPHHKPMHRWSVTPRTAWEAKVESVGLTFHHGVHGLYWDESAYYALSAAEVDTLEAATNELHRLCLAAARHVIENDRFREFGIPDAAAAVIRQTWPTSPPSIYGRFDLAFDGYNPPKLLEYNADTPTTLVEAAVAQWYWLQDVFPSKDQFNSLHERLVEAWRKRRTQLPGTLHFGFVPSPEDEDEMTVHYLRDTAEQAGFSTVPILMGDIGWAAGSGRFVDLDNRRIDAMFKLYPWEWIVREEFGDEVLQAYQQTVWIEPIWKMVLSNKAILPVLWELNPDHPNLLPAYADSPHGLSQYARKPKLGREGANVTLASRKGVTVTGGNYGSEGYVYQALAPVWEQSGHYAVVGSWVIDGEAAGIGIRDSTGPVTDNTSRFVPHLFG